MPQEIPESEKRKIMKYFLETARKYEENGFLQEAAMMYGRFWPQKARRLYLSIARDAERKGLFVLAAQAYEAARENKKARASWKRHGIECRKKGMELLAREAFKNSKPEDPKYEKTRKFTFAAARLAREGMFEEAQKEWVKAAKYREGLGDFETAAIFYFNAGNLNNAKNAWKKITAKNR